MDKVLLDGKEYAYEYPELRNVADPKEVLDVRLLVDERRGQLVAWLEAAGLKGVALCILKEQHRMFVGMREDCYTGGRFWFANPETWAHYGSYESETQKLRAEIERLKGE